MSKAAYRRYLRSPYWRRVKRALKRQRGVTCERCGRGGRLEVHHVSYAHLGRELGHLEDLLLLCRTCHRALHGRLPSQRVLRAVKWLITGK